MQKEGVRADVSGKAFKIFDALDGSAIYFVTRPSGFKKWTVWGKK